MPIGPIHWNRAPNVETTMHRGFLILCLTIVALTFTISRGFSFEMGRRYLDYGNGMINLDNITYITPQIDYIVTVPGDSLKEYFSNYSTLDMSKNSISDVANWFNSDDLSKQDYYFLQIHGYIKFDNFTLTMIKKQTFLKIPKTKKELIVVQKRHGANFIQFLEKLRGITSISGSGAFTTYEPMSNTAYLKFIELFPPLTSSDANKIKYAISSMASDYKEIIEDD